MRMGDCHNRRNSNFDASDGLEICRIAPFSGAMKVLLSLLVDNPPILLVDVALGNRAVLLPLIAFVLANGDAQVGVRCT